MLIYVPIAGTEALFADLGHFSVRAIQISMSMVTYPAIILQYSGQAAYLRVHPADVTNAFYKAIPGPYSVSAFHLRHKHWFSLV